MHRNIEDFSHEDIHRIASNAAAQKLFALLQQADASALANAEKHAAKGDYDNAVNSLKDILSKPEVQDLIAQLGGQIDE